MMDGSSRQENDVNHYDYVIFQINFLNLHVKPKYEWTELVDYERHTT